MSIQGFPGSSVGKEPACNAEDPSSIPGCGRSPREGIGYPLQDAWASLVAQTVKNPPAMWETWVWSLGGEDSLEEGMATHSSILAWSIPMDRGAWWATAMGKESNITKRLSTAQLYLFMPLFWIFFVFKEDHLTKWFLIIKYRRISFKTEAELAELLVSFISLDDQRKN